MASSLTTLDRPDKVDSSASGLSAQADQLPPFARLLAAVQRHVRDGISDSVLSLEKGVLSIEDASIQRARGVLLSGMGVGAQLHEYPPSRRDSLILTTSPDFAFRGGAYRDDKVEEWLAHLALLD